MNREDLIAPLQYNLVMEIEKYTKDESKVAVKWEDQEGETKKLLIDLLMLAANKIGNVFLDKGLKKGDVALIIIPRLIEAYEVYLAALKIGIVVIPSSEMLRTKDLKYRINHGDVKAVISYYPYTSEFDEIEEMKDIKKFVIGQDAEGWNRLDEEMLKHSDELSIADTNRDDMAFLSYTSGTTGNPKGSRSYTWLGICASYEQLRPHWLCINEGDTVWATAGPGWQKWIWSPFLAVLGSGCNRISLSWKI